MKKKFILELILIILIAPFVISCSDYIEELDQENSIILPDGKVKLFVNYDIADATVINTKSAKSNYETEIKNAVLLLFEVNDENYQLESDRLLQVIKADITANSTVSQLSFIVPFYNGKCRVKILANLDNASLTKVLNYKTYPNSNTPTTIYDFKALNVPVSLLNSETLNDYLPLISEEKSVINGINGNTSLSVVLNRIYARIDLKIDPKIKDFKLLEVHLINSCKTGRYEPYLMGEFPEYSIADFVSYYKSSKDSVSVNSIYLYENLDSYYREAIPTTLVIKGLYEKDGNSVPRYYNVFLEYKIDNNYCYTVNRNSRYNVTIKKVKHFGYQTLEEAKYVPSENSAIEMEVEVDDLGFSGDILYHSTGYALSCSNSETYVYAETDKSIYNVATLNFFKNIYHPNQFKPQVSLRVLNNETKIKIENYNEIVNTPLNTPVDLKVSFSEPNISATIEIRYGGLRKLFTVHSFKMLRADSQQPIEIDDVINVQYNDNLNSYKWFKFNSTPNSQNNNVTNISFERPSKIYCFTDDNNNSYSRISSPILVFRGNNKGTLKIMPTQTYGSPFVNDFYYRKSGIKENSIHKQKRANSILIPTNEARKYVLTGNRAYDFYSEIKNDISALQDAKAEIVWSDFKFKDPNPFEPHDLIEVENNPGNYEEIILRIRKYHTYCNNNGNGNVVWGLKDKDNNWIWSWHVWLSDFVEESVEYYTNLPAVSYAGYHYLHVLDKESELRNFFEANNYFSEKCYKTYYPNNNGVYESRIYMDRNLGAKTSAYIAHGSTVTIDDAASHLGLYYQGGRKDPLPSTPYVTEQLSQILYDIVIYTHQNPLGKPYTDKLFNNVQYTITESIKQPLTFFGTNIVDWCIDNSTDRWLKGSGKGKKTIYDPSPYGWRVNWGDGSDIYTDNIKLMHFFPNNWRKVGGGIFINNNYWFPACGYRSYTTTMPRSMGEFGSYWCGDVFYASWSKNYYNYKSAFMYRKDSNNNYYIDTKSYKTGPMSDGCNVRPVLDCDDPTI